MTTHIQSTFTVDDFKDEPLAEVESGQLSSATFQKSFKGDLEGSSVVHSTVLKTNVENAMSYVAFEHVTGTIGDRSGTFVLRHATMMTPDSRSGEWVVVPHSGTGDFTGMTGTAAITEVDGAQALELDLEFQ